MCNFYLHKLLDRSRSTCDCLSLTPLGRICLPIAGDKLNLMTTMSGKNVCAESWLCQARRMLRDLILRSLARPRRQGIIFQFSLFTRVTNATHNPSRHNLRVNDSSDDARWHGFALKLAVGLIFVTLCHRRRLFECGLSLKTPPWRCGKF